MDISVVIPTYNRAEMLGKTLKALALQRTPGEQPPVLDYEVIIVDDGSSDGTGQLCREAEHDFPVPLHYIRQANQKQGAARNRGAQAARGRCLLFLGDDTVPSRDFLARHREAHRSRDDPQRLAVIGYTPWAEEYPVTRFMEYIGEYGWQFGFSIIENPEDVPFNFFYTSNVSLPRRLFLDSGGFDEDFQEYGWEDIELSWRLKQEGMRIIYEPRAVARHHHPTSLKSFLERQRKVGYSAWTFHLKHPEMDDFLHTRRLPDYTLVQRLKMALLKWACLLTEKRSWPDLSGYYPDLLSYHYNLGLVEACDEE
ncbi:MAG TPA: glycosyltransferase family A protein [Acidobacteriota bacterium]|nr:glycosyltransferase family A protein [Acidobacteriota bacterium]